VRAPRAQGWRRSGAQFCRSIAGAIGAAVTRVSASIGEGIGAALAKSVARKARASMPAKTCPFAPAQECRTTDCAVWVGVADHGRCAFADLRHLPELVRQLDRMEMAVARAADVIVRSSK